MRDQHKETFCQRQKKGRPELSKIGTQIKQALYFFPCYIYKIEPCFSFFQISFLQTISRSFKSRNITFYPSGDPPPPFVLILSQHLVSFQLTLLPSASTATHGRDSPVPPVLRLFAILQSSIAFLDSKPQEGRQQAYKACCCHSTLCAKHNQVLNCS